MQQKFITCAVLVGMVASGLGCVPVIAWHSYTIDNRSEKLAASFTLPFSGNRAEHRGARIWFSPDSSQVLLANPPTLWSTDTFLPINLLQPSDQDIFRPQWSHNGRWFAACSDVPHPYTFKVIGNYEVRLWDLRTGKQVKAVPLGDDLGPRDLKFSDDDSELSWVSFKSVNKSPTNHIEVMHSIGVGDETTGANVTETAAIQATKELPAEVSVTAHKPRSEMEEELWIRSTSHDGKTGFAIGRSWYVDLINPLLIFVTIIHYHTYDGGLDTPAAVYELDPASHAIRTKFDFKNAYPYWAISALIPSPDDKRLAIVTDFGIDVIDLKTHRFVCHLAYAQDNSHLDQIWNVAFSPDSKRVSGIPAPGNVACIWNLP